LAQKSLSVLHRIDSSMIWNSYIYDKKFKWLSYNLWFSYIQFYKICFFFNVDNSNTNTNFTYLKNSFILKNNVKYFNLIKTPTRFSYYIDLYCVEFFNYILLINLYFYTNLLFYKHKSNKHKIVKKIELNTFF
jgi:hypothetical protein